VDCKDGRPNGYSGISRRRRIVVARKSRRGRFRESGALEVVPPSITLYPVLIVKTPSSQRISGEGGVEMTKARKSVHVIGALRKTTSL
jgi:hypothetical protein